MDLVRNTKCKSNLSVAKLLTMLIDGVSHSHRHRLTMTNSQLWLMEGVNHPFERDGVIQEGKKNV